MFKSFPVGQQAIRYGVVGIAQVGIDWTVFVLLTQFSSFLGVANIASRICGAAAGFWLNGRWTFSNTVPQLGPRHLLRFAVSWGLMTALSTVVVLAIDRGHGLEWARIIKPFSDAVLAGAGFTTSKYWIYRHRTPEDAATRNRGIS